MLKTFRSKDRAWRQLVVAVDGVSEKKNENDFDRK